MRYLMRFFYITALYLLVPIILLRLWWRSKSFKAYKDRWGERFGFSNLPPLKNVIWVHAVSFGEAAAAEGLIRALREQYPHCNVVVTTMTPTGSAHVTKVFEQQIFHVYLPYDLPFAAKGFLDRIQPRLAILMETELWPNLLHACGKRQIPILLANARLSPSSFRGYRLIAPLVRQMLKHVTQIAAQTPLDAERFRALGATENNILVTGSVKFDVKIPDDLIHQGRALRYSWDLDRPIWIAASTHQGEEEQLLQVFAELRKTLPTLMLILVPRHPQRFEKVFQLCKKEGYEIIRRSEGLPCKISTDIFLGDTMGELFLMYAAADVAFVGGSLVSIGGHNLLEPAAVGLPVISGHYLHNFLAISDLLQQAGAAFISQNNEELVALLLRFLQNEKERQQAGEAGQRVVASNRGALAKHLKWIEQHFIADEN